MTSVTPAAKYGREYVAWKNWARDESFGRLNKISRAYFSAEIRRAGLTRINDVVEIGFGDGAFLAFGKHRGWNVTGTEANAVLIEQARRAGFRVLTAEAFATLPDGAFDLIAAFDVLEHIEQDEIGAFLSLLRRKLRRGGVLLARFPNGDSPLGLSAQNGDVTHVTALGRGKIEYFARTTGFDMVWIGGQARPLFCGSPKLFLQRMIVIPVTILLEFIINSLFFTRKVPIAFFSPNLVVALRKSDADSGGAR